MKNSITVNTRISGEYRFQVFGENKKLKLDTGWFENLITDGFFNGWVGGSSLTMNDFVLYCGVGSGTAVPANSNTSITQIGSRVGSFSRVTSTSGNVNAMTIQYRFAASAIIGTIAEVGIFSAASGGTLTSRTLIKDVSGVATTITLVSGDVLYVTWRARFTVSQTDVTGVVSISGVNYNYVLRPANWTDGIPSSSVADGGFIMGSNNSSVSNHGLGFGCAHAYATQTLGVTTGAPAGTKYSAGVVGTAAAYTSGSFSRTITCSFSVAAGNTGAGIGSVLFNGHITNTTLSGYQISFAKVSDGTTIPKDGTKVFTFSMTYTYSR